MITCHQAGRCSQIEREIAKLSEDSAKDVQRQLEQQHLAEKEERIKEVGVQACFHRGSVLIVCASVCLCGD